MCDVVFYTTFLGVCFGTEFCVIQGAVCCGSSLLQKVKGHFIYFFNIFKLNLFILIGG